MVRTGKLVAHKFSRVKSSAVGPEAIQATVPDHFGGHGQHNSCVIHKQGGGYEIRLSLCPAMKTAFMVQSQADRAEGQAHSRVAECNSRQVVQTSKLSRQSGLCCRKCSTTYVRDGTHLRWICLSPGSTTNFPGLCPQC